LIFSIFCVIVALVTRLHSRSYKNEREFMNKTACILKYCAITVNMLLAIFLTLLVIGIHPSGSLMTILLAVVFCSILNIILLALSRRLLAGAIGVFFLCLFSVLNIGSLLGVIACLAQWGLPGQPMEVLAVILWLVFPIITLPAIFLVRSQLNKNGASDCGTITCPNCATEISIN
jgi:hypothetical protein